MNAVFLDSISSYSFSSNMPEQFSTAAFEPTIVAWRGMISKAQCFRWSSKRFHQRIVR